MVGAPKRPQALRARHRGGIGAFVSKLERQGLAYLSHSKVSTVERCRQCYYEQYVLGVQPEGPALQTGTLVHKAAQVAYERLRAGRLVDFAALARKTAASHPEPSCRSLVANGVATLSAHLWTGHEIIGVEEPFLLELAEDLPPVLGVVDLILREGSNYLVVDHKTGRQFGEADAGQLVLYSEYVRREYGAARCDGVFDQYRMVPDLARVRTPVHRRTQVAIGPRHAAALRPRYRKAWDAIQSIRTAADAWRGGDCWYCSRRPGAC